MCDQRFVLTGTPIENRLQRIVESVRLSHARLSVFPPCLCGKLERPIAQSKDPQAGQQLSRLVQPFLLRRLKQEVLKELPPKMEHVRKVRLSPEEQEGLLCRGQRGQDGLCRGGAEQASNSGGSDPTATGLL